MIQPWHLEFGPDYDESLAEARYRAGPRFEYHLKALTSAARLTPMESDSFLTEYDRVRESGDPAHGYKMSLYFEVHPSSHACTLKWVEVGPWEPEIDPWDP